MVLVTQPLIGQLLRFATVARLWFVTHAFDNFQETKGNGICKPATFKQPYGGICAVSTTPTESTGVGKVHSGWANYISRYL
uniref:Secreted protein n=1 Tax=Chromera velia CCMP2878 TaxID=1169474 RepID=A0A0G4H0K9_9ALVE|mmetsp:Transcript_4605/g.9263  ORF Transcript_4605/g.9263 Transcript_4605/m.9263 type:complete len:81 (-) Transcript_4605:2002-2244(-)|eukprot:Cvel_5500.t1-p1 / transcript=Cvel_5500.t1 / gene=Cvel_5500 / organism=Chromera_velia_CCMP2878 / gene_product=hypothetical protein / transcript_product=hypothetical protein / location=Cvel_scaffold257:66847-67176(+) / protein_length=80 / sequence_SO=supercontig / SO=protein_coding / is_pseudo=false